ncbi:WhiB family transcriptional regulator [Ornithinimicrobium murale]|uniref:WhiB family transcriptional regulator n=1 Tax=Ornithinimicrobium murale TaxID=1050153 RepID=UPI003B5055E7
MARAQSVCAGCPLIETCLRTGIKRGEYGVWGGVLLEAGAPTTDLHIERGPNCKPDRRRHTKTA